jgi:hypothetical protein
MSLRLPRTWASTCLPFCEYDIGDEWSSIEIWICVNRILHSAFIFEEEY